ncbi:MAG: transglycosylase SLT domain-containing protein [Syntrophobacteraceae bacterium]|nr:transglycosylase SLT domain-containing protein [Syntrophobacteraceae bacterium]
MVLVALALLAGCSTFSSRQTSASLSAHASKDEAGSLQGEGLRAGMRKGASGGSKSELVIPDHPSIDTWTAYYAEKKHQSFQTLLRRAEPYVLPVQRIFTDQGLPSDLVYVALVESGFTPTARSRADAVGMWQFIASTGERFGLEQNKWVDERRHPFKAAQAAAAYLSVLYDQFGSWDLALAAYNCGENRVQRTLDESGYSTFWELRDAGLLPLETQDYVPKFFAAARISRNVPQYGFHFSPKPDTPRHETVPVPGGVKLAWLGKKIGVEESVLQDHNPELCSPTTPPGVACYDLSVPNGLKETILAVLSEPPPPEEKPVSTSPRSQRATRAPAARPSSGKAAGPVAVKDSRKGRPAAQIAASKADTSVASKAAPGAKGGKPTKDGKVARKDNPAGIGSSSARKNETARPGQKSGKTFWYAIRQGDTLPSVAQRFGVSVEALASVNQLSRNQKLVPGKLLTICTQERSLATSQKKQAN